MSILIITKWKWNICTYSSSTCVIAKFQKYIPILMTVGSWSTCWVLKSKVFGQKKLNQIKWNCCLLWNDILNVRASKSAKHTFFVCQILMLNNQMPLDILFLAFKIWRHRGRNTGGENWMLRKGQSKESAIFPIISWQFLVFFWHLPLYLSQNWRSDGHLEVLNRSKS